MSDKVNFNTKATDISRIGTAAPKSQKGSR
jgi:hypothetical protein